MPSPATSWVVPSAVWNLTLWETNGGVTSLPGEGPGPRSIGTRLCHLTPSTHCYHPALCQTCYHLTSCTWFSQRFLCLPGCRQPAPLTELLNEPLACLKKWNQSYLSQTSGEKQLKSWGALVIVQSNQSRSHFPKSAFECGHDYCQTNLKCCIFNLV